MRGHMKLERLYYFVRFRIHLWTLSNTGELHLKATRYVYVLRLRSVLLKLPTAPGGPWATCHVLWRTSRRPPPPLGPRETGSRDAPLCVEQEEELPDLPTLLLARFSLFRRKLE